MKKIAFLDLLFNWPPSGGSFIDLKEVMSHLNNKLDYKIKLFVPDFPFLFPRGVIKEKLDFEFEKVPFNFLNFNYHSVPTKFIEALESFNPDIVFLGDGHMLKLHLAYHLSKKFKVILRSYTYELFCPLLYWYDYKRKLNCDNTILKNQFSCFYCFNKNIALIELIKILTYPLLRRTPRSLFHEFYFSLAFLPFYKQIVLEGIKKSHIIANNDWTSEILGKYNKNIHIIPGGVDINRFKPELKQKGTIKKIFLSGRITDPLKGFKVLKKACKILWNERRDFELCITLNQKSLMSKFCREDFIHNLGWISYEEIHKSYQESDICVIPSLWREGFPLSALEIMACGKPVIASETRGLKVSIIDGLTGYLVPQGDTEKLAEKIRYLLDNPHIREEMGKAGRKRVENEYTWEKVIEKYYIPLFESL